VGDFILLRSLSNPVPQYAHVKAIGKFVDFGLHSGHHRQFLGIADPHARQEQGVFRAPNVCDPVLAGLDIFGLGPASVDSDSVLMRGE
jgi:hypothetical protein